MGSGRAGRGGAGGRGKGGLLLPWNIITEMGYYHWNIITELPSRYSRRGRRRINQLSHRASGDVGPGRRCAAARREAGRARAQSADGRGARSATRMCARRAGAAIAGQGARAWKAMCRRKTVRRWAGRRYLRKLLRLFCSHSCSFDMAITCRRQRGVSDLRRAADSGLTRTHWPAPVTDSDLLAGARDSESAASIATDCGRFDCDGLHPLPLRRTNLSRGSAL